MLQSDDNLSPSQLDYDAWREVLRSMCGRYNPEGVEPNAFAGWVRPVSVSGITALNIGCNAHRVERTSRDARLDGVDHYFAVFQVGGQSAMTHNDQAVRLAVGDVAFVDAAQPVTYFADNNGAPWNTVTLTCRASHWCPILDSSQRVVFIDAAERRRGVCSSTSFRRPTGVKDLRSRPLIHTCSWPSMISSAHYSHRPTPGPSRVMRTSCSRASAALSRTALPIQISVLARWQPKRGSRCVTCRSSLLSAARPAVNSYIRFVWITPRAFYIAGRSWPQISLSARSLTPAAFATIEISPENFAIDSVARRAPTPEITPS